MHERVLSKVILSIFRFNSLGINEMNEELEVQIRKALESSWSDKTSFCYSPEFPASYGQCAQTAIVVREKFGGEILKTRGWEENGKHFYNRINGRRYDFTSV
jgi:hypothetical protein